METNLFVQIGQRLLGPALDRPKKVMALLLSTTALCTLSLLLVPVDAGRGSGLLLEGDAGEIHERITADFKLFDTLALLVVNGNNEAGAFNPQTLSKVRELGRMIRELSGPDSSGDRVVNELIVSPDTSLVPAPDGLGRVRFRRLADSKPETLEQTSEMQRTALEDPFLRQLLVSEDGKTLALRIPVSSKRIILDVAAELNEKLKKFRTDGDLFYLTGVSFADALSPKVMRNQTMAALLLGLVLLYPVAGARLPSWKLWGAAVFPFVAATLMVSGAMRIFGLSIGVMEPMLPILLLPVSLVTSLLFLFHIPVVDGGRKTIPEAVKQGMSSVSTPLGFGVCGTGVAFLSLMLIPAPSIQLFGLFAALGTLLSWVVAQMFIPATLVSLDEKQWENFTVSVKVGGGATVFSGMLAAMERAVREKKMKMIGIGYGTLLAGLAGLVLLHVDEGVLNWYGNRHPIKIAAGWINRDFGGVHRVNLTISGIGSDQTTAQAGDWVKSRLSRHREMIGTPQLRNFLTQIDEEISMSLNTDELADRLTRRWEQELFSISIDDDAAFQRLSLAIEIIGSLKNTEQLFKRPDLLQYLSDLRDTLLGLDRVGRVDSVVEVIKRVHQDLYEGDPERHVIPDTVNGVTQALEIYQEHPGLSQLITPDFTRINLQIWLRDDEFATVDQLVRKTTRYLNGNPPPVRLQIEWSGEAYLGMKLQDGLGSGGVWALMVSLVLISVLAVVQFRSFLFAMLSITLPVLVTAMVYGFSAMAGKGYDVATAVLMAPALGVPLCFGLVLLQRCRASMADKQDWDQTISEIPVVSGNMLLRCGFIVSTCLTPLLLATFLPCRFLGGYLLVILLMSAPAALLLIPSLQGVLLELLYKKTAQAGKR